VRDYRRIGRFLRDLQVDLAMLQEVDARHVDPRAPAPGTSTSAAFSPTHPRSLEQGGLYHLVPAPAIIGENGWYGNAILSRFPVMQSASVDVSQPGFEPRNIQHASVLLGDRTLRVINTHKGLKKRERLSQFKRLHEQVEALEQVPEPTLLGGDFNEWQLFTRIFRKLNQQLHALPAKATFPARFPLFRLDRLWVSHGSQLRVEQYRVMRCRETRLYSDHCPLIMDLAIR